MSYQNLKCRHGHSFRALVVSKYARIECPECKRKAQQSDTRPLDVHAADFTSVATDLGHSNPTTTSESFSSGDGGSFGGGGASGDW